MKKVVFGIVLVVLVLGVGTGMMWKKGREGKNSVNHRMEPVEEGTEDKHSLTKMVANAATKEEAERIALLYGIQLVKYFNTAAVYETEKDPNTLIRLGEEKGYPPISVDYVYSVQ